MIFAGPTRTRILGYALTHGTNPAAQSTFKQSFDNNAIQAGGNLTYSASSPAVASNGIYGYFAGGLAPGSSRTAVTSRYTFATDLGAVGTSLSSGRANGTGLSSLIEGMFFNGAMGGGGTHSTARDDINFSTGARVTGTGIDPYRESMGGAGTTTAGYLFGGSPASGFAATVARFPFATKVVANVAALAVPRSNIAAVASDSHAYLFAGNPGAPSFSSNIVQKMAFSNNAFTTLPSVPVASSNAGAAANAAGAIFITNGTNSYSYSFLTDTNSATTALGRTAASCSSLSSAPAGF